MALLILFLIDLSIKLIYLPFFYYRYSDTGIIIGVVDGLAYLLKSLEIAGGNFTPIRTHGMGLSLLAAPIFKLLGSNSIFVNMVYAHFINIFISSLCIFPLYFIAKIIFTSPSIIPAKAGIHHKKYTYLTIILFIFSFWSLYAAIGFFAEPLFTLVLLMMLLLIIKANDDYRWLLLAALFAGFGYWIKPTGILFPIIILVSLLLPKASQGRRPCDAPNIKAIIAVIIIFLAITAPVFWQRHVHFGSFFNYGENSKYFIDSPMQVWSQRDAPISLGEYLKTHHWFDYFNKFIFFGLGGLIFSLLAITLPYSIFSIWGMIMLIIARPPPDRRSKLFSPLWLLLITIAVWLIGFIPIFHVYFTPRHLFPLIPLMAVFAAFAVQQLNNPPPPPGVGQPTVVQRPRYSGRRKSIGLAVSLVSITALFFAVGFIYPQYYFINPRSNQELKFGRWAAANLRGKLAISIAGDFVMMNLPDATIAGRGLFDITAPRSGLELVYPGYFTDPDKLKKWLMDNDVKYLALTRGNQQQRIIVPPIIYEGKLNDYPFKKIHSASDRHFNWQIDVYELLP